MSSPGSPRDLTSRLDQSLYHSSQNSLSTYPSSDIAPASSDSTSSDKLSALPGNANQPSPYLSPRNGRKLRSPSPSAPPSLRAARPFSSSPEVYDAREYVTEGPSSHSSPRQRVSFEGGRVSPVTNHSARTDTYVHPLLREAVSRTARGMDSPMTRMNRSGAPSRSSSAVRAAVAGTTGSPKMPGHESPAASASHSRATSPIRLFGWPGFHHSHEDAFVPVDPFQIRSRLSRFPIHSGDLERLPLDSTCEGNPLCCFSTPQRKKEDGYLSFLRDAPYFILDTIPRLIYLHLLFRLPSLYFSRIARLYEDAQLSKPDLERMVESYSTSRQLQQRQRIVRSSPIPPSAHYRAPDALPFPDEWTTTNASPALVRFKQSWEALIDSLLREWKTLNLVSVLLHSAILSMFQNQQMANDPVIRTAALLSLTSALMSLIYGCIYIVRFGTMRSMHKATRWAEEAARTTTFILWNVWVLLAMPAIWLAWSMVFFIVAILAFVWRYGSSTDPVSPQSLSPTAAIGPRVAISALFFVGLLYLFAIINTLRSYGKTSEERLLERLSRASEATEADPREQGSQRGHETARSYGDDRNRDRESTARREQTEPSGLSAVLGLGLRGLDDFANSQSSEDLPEKKPRATEVSV